jgi:hypothetical protein
MSDGSVDNLDPSKWRYVNLVATPPTLYIIGKNAVGSGLELVKNLANHQYNQATGDGIAVGGSILMLALMGYVYYPVIKETVKDVGHRIKKLI